MRTRQSRVGEDPVVNQAELQKLAKERIKDAGGLLQGKRRLLATGGGDG
jgi:hypothetical protein